jgi:hypothetical protein
LFLGAWLGADQRNIAPDAITRATTSQKTYKGELSFLTDGQHPGNSEAPGAFVWPNNGNLSFQFEEPHPIAGLRIYVGEDAGNYWLTAYRSAPPDETGQIHAAVVVADTSALDLLENTWVEMPFPPETEADYVVVRTESSAIFYEIEILMPETDPSVVTPGSWGAIKAGQQTER